MKKILILVILIMIGLFIFRDSLLQDPFWGKENTLGILNGLLGFVFLFVIYHITKGYIEKGYERLKKEWEEHQKVST